MNASRPRNFVGVEARPFIDGEPVSRKEVICSGLSYQIVSARRLGEPETNRSLFDLLRRNGIVEEPLAEKLYAMADFRSILVHGYQGVDLRIVRDILENHLIDLLAFVAAIRAAQL